MSLPRANPHLNEAIDALHEHFLICFGNYGEAWSRLSNSEIAFIDAEIEHCIREPRYYLENYHCVKTEYDGMKTLYPFWESQEIFYEEIRAIQARREAVRALVLKARQQGLSTISEGLVFQKTIFTPQCNTLIVAQDGSQASFLFDMSRTAYDTLPWWMRPELRYEQAGKMMQFDRADEFMRQTMPGLKSNIFVEAANKPSGVARGKTVRAMHASELASWEDGGQLTKSIFPTMNSPDTLAIMESTADGRSGFFYNFWKQTENGKTDWHPIFIEFFRVKKYSRPIKQGTTFIRTDDEHGFCERIERDKGVQITDETLNWMRMRKEEFIASEGDEFGFYGEYPATPTEAFQGSGICAFPKRLLQKMLDTSCCNPKWVGEIKFDRAEQRVKKNLRVVGSREMLSDPEQEDRFWVWEQPIEGEQYYVACDPSMGVEGGDYAAVEVLRIGRGMAPDVQVAEWRGWMNPTPMGYVVTGIAMWYNDAEIAVEVNNVGIQTQSVIQREIEYDNFYRWKHIDKVKNFLTDHTGWYTNFKTRDVIIAKMAEALASRTITIYSSRLIDEMLDFSQDEGGGKFQGQDSNDDRVMGMLICHYCAHDSDYGKQASAQTSAPVHEKNGQWFVFDQANRVIMKTASREAAATKVAERSGYSMVQAPDARDFQNTLSSPIHQGTGIRNRMFYEMGYPAENINHESVFNETLAEAPPDADDPDAWKYL